MAILPHRFDTQRGHRLRNPHHPSSRSLGVENACGSEALHYWHFLTWISVSIEWKLDMNNLTPDCT